MTKVPELHGRWMADPAHAASEEEFAPARDLIAVTALEQGDSPVAQVDWKDFDGSLLTEVLDQLYVRAMQPTALAYYRAWKEYRERPAPRAEYGPPMPATQEEIQVLDAWDANPIYRNLFGLKPSSDDPKAADNQSTGEAEQVSLQKRQERAQALAQYRYLIERGNRPSFPAERPPQMTALSHSGNVILNESQLLAALGPFACSFDANTLSVTPSPPNDLKPGYPITQDSLTSHGRLDALSEMLARLRQHRVDRFQVAAGRVVEALKTGGIGAEGQLEPISRHKGRWERIPAWIVETRQWRWFRENGVLVGLDEAGQETDERFRHVRLKVQPAGRESVSQLPPSFDSSIDATPAVAIDEVRVIPNSGSPKRGQAVDVPYPGKPPLEMRGQGNRGCRNPEEVWPLLVEMHQIIEAEKLSEHKASARCAAGVQWEKGPASAGQLRDWYGKLRHAGFVAWPKQEG